MSTARPLDRLMELTRTAASGEFICVTSNGEVHVYLQRGRIAWATDSRHPFAFAAHLQETAGIDVDTFRQVVEECRRDRLPLGETLVEWGLATRDVVRSALAHQISVAISLLASTETSQTLFLTRGYGSYDEQLTFGIDDFIQAPQAAAEPPAAAPTLPPTTTNLSGRLRTSIEGLSWVELYDGERLTDSDPRSPTPRLPLGIMQATLLDGADFAAIRSTRTSLIGLSVAAPKSVWCRIAADSTFGVVVSAIGAIAGRADRPAERPPPRPDVTAWTLGPPDAVGGEAVRSFLHRAQEVLGCVVLGREPEKPVFGCGSSALAPDASVEVARRRARALVQAPLPGADDTERALDSIGYSMKSMVSGEPRLWCFGAELDLEGDTLWLFLDRRTSQGLGWAYLAALTRTLSGARSEAR